MPFFAFPLGDVVREDVVRSMLDLYAWISSSSQGQSYALGGTRELFWQTVVEVGFTAEFPNLGIPTELALFCSVIPRKKWLIPVHSDLHGIAVSELQNGTERNSDGINII